MKRRKASLWSAAIRVLVVTPYPAGALSHGGRVRTFQLAAGLARLGADVDLVCPWSPGQAWRGYRRDGVRVRPQLSVTLPLLAISDDWLPSAVTASWEVRLPRVRRLLRQADQYDIAQFESPGHGPWIERLPRGVRGVYASHNVEADFAARRVASAGPIRRRLAEGVANLERRVARASNLTLACTDADADRLGDLYGSKCAVIPNGFDDAVLTIDRERLRPQMRERLGVATDELVLLFVGGDAEHNRSAVRALEQQVLPAVGRPVRLVVIGKAADGLSGTDERAVRVGFVEDLRPWLAAADVGLNPVAYGSGSNLKVAEYLAAGLPVLTTPVGARGFHRWADRMRLAEIPDFASALESLPAPGAPPPGIEELAWSAIAKRLHEIYSELI